MKMSKEDWQRIDEIKTKKLGSECDTFEDLNYCLMLLEKFRPKPERFTYQMVACDFCVISDAQPCRECGGLGKRRVKVKRTAHSV